MATATHSAPFTALRTSVLAAAVDTDPRGRTLLRLRTALGWIDLEVSPAMLALLAESATRPAEGKGQPAAPQSHPGGLGRSLDEGQVARLRRNWELRTAGAGLTIAAIAAEVGCSAATVSNYYRAFAQGMVAQKGGAA